MCGPSPTTDEFLGAAFFGGAKQSSTFMMRRLADGSRDFGEQRATLALMSRFRSHGQQRNVAIGRKYNHRRVFIAEDQVRLLCAQDRRHGSATTTSCRTTSGLSG
jgi:hypothetical protein